MNVATKFGLVIHGGAGIIRRANISPELEQEYRKALTFCLQTGYEVLKNHGTSLDAVVAAIQALEDCPLFNAGKGSVFSNEGKNEMDASIMDGRTLKAGAISGVSRVKNPIKAALAVMNKTKHVMLIGQGAEKFAEENGLEMEDPSYFWTERRWLQYQKLKDTKIVALDHNVKINDKDKLTTEEKNTLDAQEKNQSHSNNTSNQDDPNKYEKRFGTVGAVAFDIYGNIAAGTSTGGMTNKMPGRVGDSPIIGAGTYANNKTCAISCTGDGEFFIRSCGAYDVSAIMEHGGKSLKEASEMYIHKRLKELGGDGGLIGVDSKGNIVMPFNSEGMYRGYVTETGEIKVFIYDECKGKEWIPSE